MPHVLLGHVYGQYLQMRRVSKLILCGLAAPAASRENGPGISMLVKKTASDGGCDV
jgi:hypothetical protein